MDEHRWLGERRASDRTPTVAAIFASLLVAAVAFAAILAVLFGSFLLLAMLIDLGVPLTVALGAIVALSVERSITYLLIAWRPPVLDQLTSAVPAAAIAVAIHACLPWSPWSAIPAAAAAGLGVQAMALSYLTQRHRPSAANPQI